MSEDLQTPLKDFYTHKSEIAQDKPILEAKNDIYDGAILKSKQILRRLFQDRNRNIAVAISAVTLAVGGVALHNSSESPEKQTTHSSSGVGTSSVKDHEIEHHPVLPKPTDVPSMQFDQEQLAKNEMTATVGEFITQKAKEILALPNDSTNSEVHWAQKVINRGDNSSDITMSNDQSNVSFSLSYVNNTDGQPDMSQLSGLWFNVKDSTNHEKTASMDIFTDLETTGKPYFLMMSTSRETKQQIFSTNPERAFTGQPLPTADEATKILNVFSRVVTSAKEGTKYVDPALVEDSQL